MAGTSEDPGSGTPRDQQADSSYPAFVGVDAGSDPACARHGADPRQVDISAIVIRIFEYLSWATGVHWPVPARLDRRRRDQGRPQAAPVLQDGEALIPPALRLTVNPVHYTVNTVARN